MGWTIQDKQDMVARINTLLPLDQLKFPYAVREGERGFTEAEAELYLRLSAKWTSQKAQAQADMLKELPDNWQKKFPEEVRQGKRKMTGKEWRRYHTMMDDL